MMYLDREAGNELKQQSRRTRSSIHPAWVWRKDGCSYSGAAAWLHEWSREQEGVLAVAGLLFLWVRNKGLHPVWVRGIWKQIL